jgi:hypothetical protein
LSWKAKQKAYKMKKEVLAVLELLNKSEKHEDPAEIFGQCSVPKSQWKTLLAYLKGKVYMVYAGGTDLPISFIIDDPGRRYLHEHKR